MVIVGHNGGVCTRRVGNYVRTNFGRSKISIIGTRCGKTDKYDGGTAENAKRSSRCINAVCHRRQPCTEAFDGCVRLESREYVPKKLPSFTRRANSANIIIIGPPVNPRRFFYSSFGISYTVRQSKHVFSYSINVNRVRPYRPRATGPGYKKKNSPETSIVI